MDRHTHCTRGGGKCLLLLPSTTLASSLAAFYMTSKHKEKRKKTHTHKFVPLGFSPIWCVEVVWMNSFSVVFSVSLKERWWYHRHHHHHPLVCLPGGVGRGSWLNPRLWTAAEPTNMSSSFRKLEKIWWDNKRSCPFLACRRSQMTAPRDIYISVCAFISIFFPCIVLFTTGWSLVKWTASSKYAKARVWWWSSFFF